MGETNGAPSTLLKKNNKLFEVKSMDQVDTNKCQ